MSCTANYLALSTSDRIRTALAELKAGGVPRGKAITMVAIARNESANIWVRPRTTQTSATPGTTYAPLPCWSCRTIVGLEVVHPSGGLPNVAYYRQSIMLPENAAARAWLTANGWLSVLPSGPAVTRDMNVAGGDAIAAFLEWVMIHRAKTLLDQFSIGPTQLYLPVHFRANGEFPDWNALFRFYMANNAAVIGKVIKYSGWTPGDDPTQRDRGIAWLEANQTGSYPSGIATKYWDGVGYVPLKESLRIATAAAQSIGY